MSKGRRVTIGWRILKPLIWIWNPFPKLIKVPAKRGGYVRDIRTRKSEKKLEETERLRRRREGEDDVKVFKVYPAGSIELEGRSE